MTGRRRVRIGRRAAIGLAGVLVAIPAVASAAGPDPKWTIELYGGAGVGINLGHGKSQMPAPGATFLPAPFPGIGNTRAVSSWYFGDGALLFNQNQAQASSGTRILSLDSALTGPGIEPSAPGFGIRIDRLLTRRVSLEFDLQIGRPSLTGDVREAVELSRASFATAFQALFSRDQIHLVSSTAAIDDKARRQVVAVGGWQFSPKADGAVLPYLFVGAGVAHVAGSNSTVALAGDYLVSFDGSAINSFHQRDQVIVRYRAAPHQFVGVLGGGVNAPVSARSGIRIDTRLLISKEAGSTFVSATPLPIPSGFGAEVLGSTPSLSFSGTPSIRSSLSGPAFADFQTFSGGGVRMRLSLTVGYVVRF